MAGGHQSIEAYLTPQAREATARAIEEADGNEVFFLGRPDESGLIGEIEVHCRGHKTAVPALRQIGRPGEVVIHNHPSGRLTPSDPDLALASHYGQEGVGFLIVDNGVQDIYVVVEPLRETTRPVDPSSVDAVMIGETGLPGLLDGYEPRPGQVEMAQAVAGAQNEDRILVVEAGTGTGKSLAYLVPSALRALQNQERVAISTRTRHLQGQLLRHDVPLLQKLRPDLEVAILKGRGNYLCRRKLGERMAELRRGGIEDEDEVRFLHQTAAWVETTKAGERDDLPFVPDFRHWELVQSNTEHTRRARCPHFEECFYYNSRRQAAGAHLLLVNHNLLMADRALRDQGANGLLPRYEHIVVDEAHHLEDVATEFAGRSVSSQGLLQQLGRLRPTRGRKKGLAVRLRQRVEGHGADEEALALLLALDHLLEETERLRVTLKLHFEDVAEAILEALGPDGDRGRRTGTLRIEEDLEEAHPILLKLLSDRLGDLARLLSSLARSIHDVLKRLEDMPPAFARSQLQVGLDMGTVRNRILDAAGTLGLLLEPDPRVVRWIDVFRDQQDQPRPRFHLRPIEVDQVIDATLMQGVRSVTLTSATLSVAGRFKHFEERTGLGKLPGSEGRMETRAIPSPFDYEHQVWLGIPDDLPDPGDPVYSQALASTVARAVEIVGGRSFVLFTSYRMLRRTAAEVGRILGRNITILKQGDLPREQLLRLFRESQRTVLFGTDSFWEGVDVRGEALSCVVITRLPFRVPSEPIQQARAEQIEQRGGDPFRKMAIPQAVLRFRQGFGRLVRHKQDRGVVLVLDGRIVRRSYGKSFLRSLPAGVTPVTAATEVVLKGMEGFLEVEGALDSKP
ncbi:MAG: helicase C-terminal domain-containing protein [Myxococcota bacterium]|nr:helicase C-terminal domain-containing protein [Myxococcota bacterium]